MEGYYVDHCNKWYAWIDYAHAHLAEAFNTSCSIAGLVTANLCLDIGALVHLTIDPPILDQFKNYTNKCSVIVGKCDSLPITLTGLYFLLFQIFTY